MTEDSANWSYWRAHDGSSQPILVENNTIVEVLLANGATRVRCAQHFYWEVEVDPNAIVAYRVKWGPAKACADIYGVWNRTSRSFKAQRPNVIEAAALSNDDFPCALYIEFHDGIPVSGTLTFDNEKARAECEGGDNGPR